MTDSGALMFARYAFPPNDLGYCGPAGARDMLVPGAVDDILRRARRFEGAWVYLEVLAAALGYDDPLADEVVAAYWIGSERLAEVDPAELLVSLEQRFQGQDGGTWRDSSDRARAHHSYQVFEVYPWAAMLRAGLPPGPAVDVLDQCRIRTGTVVAVDGELVVVSSRRLVWHDGRLEPGPTSTGRARWAVDGRSLLTAPAVDDVVALHWDWVCDVLTPAQATLIEHLDRDQRAAVGLS